MSLLVSLLVGFLLAALIGFVAFRRGSLTGSGVIGALVTGTAIFGFGGFVPGLLLVAFFVSSTLLSGFRERSKKEVNEKFQKGSRRDLGQALANGGWPAVLAVGIWYADAIVHDARLGVLFTFAFVGAVATVTADTWATEIGVLSKSLPRLITTGRIVPTGTSGGITLLGTVTALLGGMFVGGMFLIGVLIASQLFPTIAINPLVALQVVASNSRIVGVAAVSGLAGSLFDSLLGATVQGIYFSEYDERQTERRVDSQDNPTRRVRGFEWMDNDRVNFLSSIFGSLIAGGFAYLIF